MATLIIACYHTGKAMETQGSTNRVAAYVLRQVPFGVRTNFEEKFPAGASSACLQHFDVLVFNISMCQLSFSRRLEPRHFKKFPFGSFHCFPKWYFHVQTLILQALVYWHFEIFPCWAFHCLSSKHFDVQIVFFRRLEPWYVNKFPCVAFHYFLSKHLHAQIPITQTPVTVKF